MTDEDMDHPLEGKFEPAARNVVSSQADAALVSIAVSLKRIADTLSNTTGDNMTLLSVMQTLEMNTRRPWA